MSFASVAFRIASGPLAWILHFAAIYAATALACARGTPGFVPWVIGVATLAAAAACIGVVVLRWPRRAEFEAWLSAGLAGVSLFAILFQASPVLVVPICA